MFIKDLAYDNESSVQLKVYAGLSALIIYLVKRNEGSNYLKGSFINVSPFLCFVLKNLCFRSITYDFKIKHSVAQRDRASFPEQINHFFYCIYSNAVIIRRSAQSTMSRVGIIYRPCTQQDRRKATGNLCLRQISLMITKGNISVLYCFHIIM